MATETLTTTPGDIGAEHVLSALLPEFLRALLHGDRRRCETLTSEALTAPVPILSLYQGLYQRALYRVGEEWACNRISVGTEHLATAIVEGLLNRLYPEIMTPHRTGRRILVGSVEGELHQVGAKMVCDTFEMHGWEALYLGADTPTAELLRTVRDLRPDAVGLSLSVYQHLGAMQAAIGLIRAEFPDLPLLIGGQGLREVGPTLTTAPGVHYIADLDDLVRFIAWLTEHCPDFTALTDAPAATATGAP